MFYTPEQKGFTPQQVDEMCEKLWQRELNGSESCHDCGAKPGEQHNENCDVARCTSCGMQRLSCDCEDGETDVWTGLWPGIRECYELKLIVFDDYSQRWCFDLNVWTAKYAGKK